MWYNDCGRDAFTSGHTTEALGGAAMNDIIPQTINNKISGIYSITNTANGHRYIGSAIIIHKRWNEHIRDLCANKHHSIYLQRAWNTYGNDYFIFSIIEQCDNDLLIDREQHYIDTLIPEYNMCRIAGSPLGYKHTDETKEKVSKAGKGRVFSDEHKKRISEALKGKIVSEETRRRIGIKSVGRIFSEDAHKKMSCAQKNRVHKKGYKLTEEQRKNISNGLMGNKNTLGIEPWNKGKTGVQKMSDEARLKMSKSRTGKRSSIESRQKMSEAKKKWWSEKKREACIVDS
jgi:group I intron endonuclease